MVSDSEKFAESDAKKRALIEETNSAENGILEIEKNLKEFKDQIRESDSQNMTKLIKELREFMKIAEDGEAVRTKFNELQTASLEVFRVAYEKRAPKNDNEQKDTDAEEAEFKQSDKK